jgi:hypothetical protein
MPADRGEPWGGATYKGFAGPTPAETTTDGAPQSQRRLRAPAWSTISRKQKIIGGVAAAVVLGLAFGLWARTGVHSRDNLSSSAEAAVTAKVPIEVTQPAPARGATRGPARRPARRHGGRRTSQCACGRCDGRAARAGRRRPRGQHRRRGSGAARASAAAAHDP